MSERVAPNPWATACPLISLAPVVAFALLLGFETLRHTSSETFDEVFYASVPISGLAAVVCGLVARRRPGGRARTSPPPDAPARYAPPSSSVTSIGV